ncbi:MAG: MerR family transcriptional regulator [Fibrobacteria bacterium]|nr:MerR family transcriptional regulator [Fibrobacteria bacterium]
MAHPKHIITDPVISIGTVAERLKVSVSTIRKYEADGLIIPFRAESGHRLFSLEDIERLRIIQHMIQVVGLNVEGIRRLQSFLPCWDIISCPQKNTTRTCPAFKETTKPCWMIKNKEGDGNNAKNCRTCIVYRFGSQCTEDVKQLVHGTSKEELRNKLEEMTNNWTQEQ